MMKESINMPSIDNRRQEFVVSDEINLIELLKVLWNKKWWVVLFSMVFVIVAGIYIFTVKEQ